MLIGNPDKVVFFFFQIDRISHRKGWLKPVKYLAEVNTVGVEFRVSKNKNG